MKIKLTAILLTCLLLLLAACAPISAPAPAVEAPAAEATAAAAPEVPAPVPPPTEELQLLRANPWQWISFTSPMEQFDVETPLSYLVRFNTDATMNIVADCNNAAGFYQGEGGTLSIEIGPMTAAACPPESRSDPFVKLLGSAALYFFQDGNLHIDLFADGGTMVFAQAPADILGDDGEGALAGAKVKLAATLGNLSYEGIFDGEAVTLTDGLYTYTEGDSAAQPVVRLLDRLVAHGDLNGDGAEDAVALIEHDSSGTGRFTYLAPVLDVWTAPAPAPALMLGDRIQMKALAIADGQVVAEYVAQGPGDGQCCPTYNVRSVYNWQDGALVESDYEEVSKVALSDLNGTSWQLVDLGESQAPLPDTEITLQFDGSAISGSAGCNTYNAEATAQEDAPQSFTVGPIATTMMACEEPVANQEAQYLGLLGSAVGWGYDGGNLVIVADQGDAPFAQLVFEPKAPAQASSAAWEAVACDTLGVRPEIAARSDCGYITVPENRAAGTDKTIQLAVVRIRSTSENPGAPVILGTGGPGSDGLGRIKIDSTFLSSRAGILEDRDWIGFTQRGTPGAIPELPCPALDRVAFNAARQGLTAEEKIELSKTSLQTCIDQVAAAGVDLTAYNSVENASDVVAVVDALGYDKFFYYGQSYGTLLGQYVLKDHGDRLAGIILDGIAPATHASWPDATDMPAAFRRVFAACAADAACAAEYPEAEAALEAGLQALDATLPSLTVPTAEGALTVTVNSTLAMHAMFGNLYAHYSALPWLAHELRDGNVASLARDIATFLSPDSSGTRLMHLAVVCSDDPLLAMDDLSMEGVPPMYQGLRADDALDYAIACPILALPQLPASYDTLVASELPALLLQGGMDPATGVPVGSTVQEGLPNSTNVIVPAGSHIVGNSPCALAIMDAFMSDPAATPDTSCVDPAIPFAVPGPVSISNADGSLTLGITLPGGVGSLVPGFWQSPDMTVALQVLDAGATAEDAINQFLKSLAIEAEGEFVDGPPIAGLPSRMAKASHPAVGDMEIYGFADERGAYRVGIGVMNPSATEEVRQNTQPALLESVTLGGE